MKVLKGGNREGRKPSYIHDNMRGAKNKRNTWTEWLTKEDWTELSRVNRLKVRKQFKSHVCLPVFALLLLCRHIGRFHESTQFSFPHFTKFCVGLLFRISSSVISLRSGYDCCLFFFVYGGCQTGFRCIMGPSGLECSSASFSITFCPRGMLNTTLGKLWIYLFGEANNG